MDLTARPPPPSPARPAATVVVCRPHDGSFQVLLIKRHGKSGFMAGAHVFPGGRVDEADHAPLLPHASELLDGMEARAATGFLHAAVRETREEVDVGIDARDFFPWSWWITPTAEPKRFDTRFFLCAVPDTTTARVDEHEAVAFAWLTPKEALRAYAAGEIVLAPPTMATLEDLLPFTTVTDAARSVVRPLRAICPRIITAEGVGPLVLALPGDPLHEVKEPAFSQRTRIVMDASGRFASATVPATGDP